MGKRVLFVIVSISVIISLFGILSNNLKNSRQGELVGKMNCDIAVDDVSIELLNDTHGGITGDGVAIYKLSINEDFDINKLDLSSWMSLPVSEDIVDQYMVDAQPKGRIICKLQRGNWKIIGENKDYGMYRNIVLYVYDEDGRCFYIYKWDS